MTALAARWRPRWDVASGRLAAWSGIALRRVGKSVPGTVGPLGVSFGLGMYSRPLGVIFAFAVLWALDRRV